MRFAIVFLVFSLLLTSCAPSAQISPTRIVGHNKFVNGLRMEKLRVERFGPNGRPETFTVDSIFRAADRWSLSEEEYLDLLTGEPLERYKTWKGIRDSLSGPEHRQYRPADTLLTPQGVRIYLSAGSRYPDDRHIAEAEMRGIVTSSIRRPERQTIYFTRSDGIFRWKARRADTTSREQSIDRVWFQPGAWYKVRQHYWKGFREAWATYYFSFDARARIRVFRVDEEG